MTRRSAVRTARNSLDRCHSYVGASSKVGLIDILEDGATISLMPRPMIILAATCR